MRNPKGQFVKGHTMSEEHKTILRKKLTGVPKSKETKEKIGAKNKEKMKKLWQDPEYKKRQIEAHKGYVMPEEQKQKIRANTPQEEASPHWKGDDVGYIGLHNWVRKWKGKADHCEMCGNDEPRMYHWANIDNEYRRVLEDYISMCVPCHRKHDYAMSKNK